jgi:CDP-paratose 2-epimerase
VYHFAAQVAVTTSLVHPLDDFAVNAQGTLFLLEALRASPEPASVPLVFTSTNKVYGNLEDVALRRRENRYEPDEETLRARGVSEERPLDFHSPYGCSKGAADQYVLDYARTFGLPATVFSDELHLWPAPARQRGPGLGRALFAARPATTNDHALW